MPGESVGVARISEASSHSSLAADPHTSNGHTVDGKPGDGTGEFGFMSKDQRPSMRAKKIGHRRVDESGQVFYKKTPTQELMETIQLGIYTSLAFAEKMGEHDLLYRDFKRIEILDFPT